MKKENVQYLISGIRAELAHGRRTVIAIEGLTPVALELLHATASMRHLDQLVSIYAGEEFSESGAVPTKPLRCLSSDKPTLVVVASDTDKENLLASAAHYLDPDVRVLIAGYAHLAFADALFDQQVRNAIVPSLANGYPNSLIHIFQCLKNAARLGLKGIVVEFGMYKGGTTMLMSRFIEGLLQAWKLYAFASFVGLPPRRSALDLYTYEGCVYTDEAMIRRMLDGRNIEIISGDIVNTIDAIAGQPIVLAFVDTDNYSPAAAILKVIQDQIVVRGAIVFDHFTGIGLYTLGERIAAKALLNDPRYFNLHETGVFIRQQ